MGRDRFSELQGDVPPTGAYTEGYQMQPSSQFASTGGISDTDFFGMIDSITGQMAEVDRRISDIAQLHEQALNATSEQRHAQVSRDRDQLVADTNAVITDIKRSLQTVDRVLQQSDPSVSKSQKVARTSRQQGLARKFSEQLQRYRQMEHQYSQRNKERLERQYRIARPDATDAEIADAIESDQAGQVFAQSIMQTSRVGEARRVLRDVEERQADIQKIERTIEELAQMFLEVAEMAERQQEMLDTIDNAVEETHGHVEMAKTEVDTAIDRRIKSRRRLRIILALVTLIIAIIVVIVVLKVKGVF
ncbi:hypothetical protein EC988_000637 [Linderina pennispora]|nr:hypothetical protein EC988_000637 [Linderina pennispora]